MTNRWIELFRDPFPIRKAIVKVIRRFQLGSYSFRIQLEAVKRPHYGYCVYQAGCLAKKLGLSRISVIEFGVAGGNGLLNLEYHGRQASKCLGIDIEVFGFDTGEGLPEPEGYRDLPYQWKTGFYKMDQTALEKKLTTAQLVLGNVRETVPTFFEKYDPAPIGALLLDLDFYSSTTEALKIFDLKKTGFLPRVHCYFDDVLGGEVELYNDYTGQRLAINEFNTCHNDAKLGKVYHLLSKSIVPRWNHQIWIAHLFDHPDYQRYIAEDTYQLELK